MNSAHDIILDSFKDLPLGETVNFIWFITDIGIVALFKRNNDYEYYNSKVDIEANKIGLDLTKEEKEYFDLKEKKFFLFYSWIFSSSF